MNKFQYLLIFIFISVTGFSQGIAVQGIARDNGSSAIGDETLNFIFNITDKDNIVLYSESQSIKTDNFGVFSHIVSTGDHEAGSSFTDVDFTIEDLKLKVSVNYNSTDITVYDQPFQYTPYAHYARKAGNGVPTGSVMPYLGEDAPEGWVLCDGKSLTKVTGADALIKLVGDNAPDLKGMFLRGTGQSSYYLNPSGPALGATQNHFYKSHSHQVSLTTTANGAHNHTNEGYNHVLQLNSGLFSYNLLYQAVVDGAPNLLQSKPMEPAENHTHSVSGDTKYSGSGNETRPINYGVNYIIKL